MKKLLTLVAGYAAGLAVAMKYRKENGKSKLATDPNTSKIDAFIDEVVDIHKSAYTDAKEYVTTNLEDVKDFDGLKAKVSGAIDTFTLEAEEKIAHLKSKGTAKKEVIEGEVSALFEKKKALLDEAKNKGASFSDVAADTVVGWIDTVKSKLEGAHTAVKSTLETTPPPAKKPTTKKAPAKKPSPKKTV